MAKTDKEKDWGHVVVFTAHKAGMDKIDKEKVSKVVFEMSNGSKFFTKAKENDAKLDIRIEALKQKLSRWQARQTRNDSVVSTGDVQSVANAPQSGASKRMDSICQIESERRLDRIWMVVDMDMFYAAVAMRDDPSLIGKPIAVGGMGMISTANYEARAFGVRSAMPGFIAVKLCPHLKFVKSDFKAYKEAATQVRDILREYDPQFESCSLDEASLDLTTYVEQHMPRSSREQDEERSTEAYYCRRMEFAATVVSTIRERVFERVRLTCSAGIAPNRMLAKIASDFNKPNGQKVVLPTTDAVLDFMRTLPTRKVPGIGKVTDRIILQVLGVKHCGELFCSQMRRALWQVFSPKTAKWLVRATYGLGRTEHKVQSFKTVGPKRKGMSLERTFGASGISGTKVLLSTLSQLCTRLEEKMQKENLRSKSVTLKLKLVDYTVRSRCRSLNTYVQSAEEIFSVARKLLLLELPVCVRLMGVRVSKFQGAADPISRTQPFISTFLRDTPDELASDTTAVSDSKFSAEVVATPNFTDPDSNNRLENSHEDNSYADKSVSATDTLKTPAASNGPAIAPTNASYTASTLRIPDPRHSRGEGLHVDRLDPKQHGASHPDRERKRKRSPEPDSSAPTSSDKRSPQGWVCSVCTFCNTSSRGGVLLPWCAMCPEGRRFPTVSKRARAVKHIGQDGRASSKNRTHSSSVRRQASRPINSFFAVDHQPLPQKPSSDRRVSPDDVIDKFVDITKATRGDAIKHLALAGNDIEAAIDIYFRNNS